LADLSQRLFARRIEDSGFRRQVCRHLLQQSRFTDARITAEQYDRTRHQPTTKNPVKLLEARSRLAGALAASFLPLKGAIRVCANVFHAEQSGHCPAHLTLWAPHSVQT